MNTIVSEKPAQVYNSEEEVFQEDEKDTRYVVIRNLDYRIPTTVTIKSGYKKNGTTKSYNSFFYSYDNITYTRAEPETPQTFTLYKFAKLYLRGMIQFTNDGENPPEFTDEFINNIAITGGDASISGNINSLGAFNRLDLGENFVLNNSHYAFLFAGSTSLKYADKLYMPSSSTTLYCYGQMFAGCTSLTTAPELPATTLEVECYFSMFYWCTSLTTAPKLPATTLVRTCYASMFEGCTSLVNAPELPATTVKGYCYNKMFAGCTSLVNAPELPATTASNDCYIAMFAGCTSLVNAPELPATTVGWYSYESMFSGCTSLVNAPTILPATSARTCCYASMFEGCTSLVNAPELPATTVDDDGYNRMFAGCTNLKYIKCLAIDIGSRNSTKEWVYNVSPTGLFVKNPSMTSWTTGDSGIPNGWEVADA